MLVTGRIGWGVNCLHSYGGELETIRFQLTGVVLNTAGDVLESGIAQRKFRFSVLQACVWDQILSDCLTLVCMPELGLFHYDFNLSSGY